MTRDELLAYVLAHYGTQPDYPFSTDTYRTTPVLRKPSGKWYGIVMSVRRELLGVDGSGTVDLVDVKVDPGTAVLARGAEGVLPAYHMNKTHWVSLLLDGTAPDGLVMELLDESYRITK